MAGPSDDEVLAWFDPREPLDGQKLKQIREVFKYAAKTILMTTPPSAHRTAALRDLLNASQSAVFAYTHQEH